MRAGVNLAELQSDEPKNSYSFNRTHPEYMDEQAEAEESPLNHIFAENSQERK